MVEKSHWKVFSYSLVGYIKFKVLHKSPFFPLTLPSKAFSFFFFFILDAVIYKNT